MQNFTAQLQSYGSKTASLNIIGSQIAWALFRASDASSVMKLETTAQLGQIFANIDISGAIPVFSSVEGVCQNFLNTYINYDPSTLLLTATVPARAPPSEAPTPQPSEEPSPAPSPRPTAPTSKTSSAVPSAAPKPTPSRPTSLPTSTSAFFEFCPEQLSVVSGTFALWRSPTHSFNVDLITTVTAFALNFGIIDTTSLTKSWSGSRNFGGDIGAVHEEDWVDDNYPQMMPVVCYYKVDSPRVCYGEYGDNTRVYPVLYNVDGQACQCPRDAGNLNCNQNNFFQLAQVFAAKDGSLESIFRAGWTLQRMMQTGPDGPNNVIKLVSGLANTAYALTSTSQYDEWRRGETVDVLKNNLPYSQFAAGFKTLGPGVSIVSFELWYYGFYANLNAQGVKLSSFATSHFNISNGRGSNVTFGYVMCKDTIFQPQALQQMALAPPVPVIQPYLSCHPTLSSAFVTAAGIAAANSALVSSIFLVLAVFLTVQYFNNFSSGGGGGGGGGRIVAPADKALRAAETEKRLLADVNALKEKMLLANDDQTLLGKYDRLLAKNESMSAELEAIKAVLRQSGLLQQQLQQQPQHQHQHQHQHQRHEGPSPPHTPLTSPSLSSDGVFGGENPLHRRGARASVVLSSARLSLTGAAPAPADEQISRYDEELRRAQQAAERRHSRFVGGNPP